MVVTKVYAYANIHMLYIYDICILSCAYYNSIQILNIYIIPHFGINKNKLLYFEGK